MSSGQTTFCLQPHTVPKPYPIAPPGKYPHVVVPSKVAIYPFSPYLLAHTACRRACDWLHGPRASLVRKSISTNYHRVFGRLFFGTGSNLFGIRGLVFFGGCGPERSSRVAALLHQQYYGFDLENGQNARLTHRFE